MSRTLAVRKSTDSLCRLVLEAVEELVELLHSQSFQEPFPGRNSVSSVTSANVDDRSSIHIWTRQFIESVEAETCVFY